MNNIERNYTVKFGSMYRTFDNLQLEGNSLAAFEYAYECEYDFNFTDKINEIPAKYNMDRHREPDNCGIPMEWVSMNFNFCRKPKIPNNLITTIKQACESPEWESLNILKTKRNKPSSLYIKLFDISSILVSMLPIPSRDQCASMDQCASLCNTLSNVLFTSTIHCTDKNDIIDMRKDYDDDVYRPFNHDRLFKTYQISYKVIDKIMKLLTTPYTHNGKMFQLLYMRTEETPKGIRRYYAWDSFFDSRRCEYDFDVERYHDYYQRDMLRRLDQMSEYSLLHNEYHNWLQLTRPLRHVYEAKVHSLIGSKIKGATVITEEMRPRKKAERSKGIVKIQKDSNGRYIYVEDLLLNADLYAYEGTLSSVFFGVDYFRHYSPYSMSNCVMRSMFQYKGKSLKQCDVSSMYPVILLQDYDQNYRPQANRFEHYRIQKIINAENPRKVLYEWAKELGIDVDEDTLKVENISYYNMDYKHSVHLAIHKLYSIILPGFTEWLAQMKLRTQVAHKGYYGHKFVSRWLEWKESVIMDRVLERCHRMNIFCVGVHDGIDVEEGHEHKVAAWIKDSMKAEGYVCNVTVE